MPEQPQTLAAALADLQGRLPRITKDDHAEVRKDGVTQYSYSYANLAAIHAAVFPLLASLGLCWTCRPTIGAADVFVLAYTLTHAPSGEKIEGTYPLPTSGRPQELGSAITYARRYCLTAVLGIAPDEDDDDGAQGAEWRPPAHPHSRKADRHHAARSGPLRDDDWTTGPPDEAPGSVSPGRLTELHITFTRAGITAREDRLAYTMSALDLPELESSRDLSEAQAIALIEHLKGDKR